MTEYSRALEQIAEIHEHLAKTEVYRGWRSLPVASSALVGIAAAAWQSATARPLDAWSFTIFWLAVGIVALVIGCSEIVWHYATRATAGERRRSLQVVGQFLPALVAGAVATPAVIQVSPSLVTLLPGLWALLFGVARVRGGAVRAARKRVGRALLLRRGIVSALARAGRRDPLTVGGRRDVWDWTAVCRGGALLEHRAAGSIANAGAR